MLGESDKKSFETEKFDVLLSEQELEEFSNNSIELLPVSKLKNNFTLVKQRESFFKVLSNMYNSLTDVYNRECHTLTEIVLDQDLILFEKLNIKKLKQSLKVLNQRQNFVQ